jgi:hypothetical protein
MASKGAKQSLGSVLHRPKKDNGNVCKIAGIADNNIGYLKE